MSVQRNIIQLRPPANRGQQVSNKLQSAGFRPRGRPRSSVQPRQTQQLPVSTLTRAIKDFRGASDPAVLQKALKYIAYSTNSDKSHSEIIASGALYELVHCLNSSDLANRSLACLALSNLAVNEVNQVIIGQAGVFQKAKELMTSDSEDLVQKAVMLLTNLTTCDDLHPVVEQCNIIEDATLLLNHGDESFCYNILLLIQNIVNLDSTHNYLIRRQGLKLVIDTVIRYEESERISEAAALIFSCLSYTEQNTLLMGRMNIFPAISIVMRKNNTNIFMYTCRTLTNLACDVPNRIPIKDCGVIPVLIELLQYDVDEYFEIVEHNLMTLGNLANVEEIANHIVTIGGSEVISVHCSSLNEDLQTRAAKLVANLSRYELPRKQLLDSGAKPSLEIKTRCRNGALANSCTIAVNNLSVPIRKLDRESVVSIQNIEKYYLQRIKIINEILDTERTYCHHLKQCVNVYMNPLAEMVESGNPLISIASHRDIFSTIEVIEKMHSQFLVELEETINEASSGQSDANEAKVGDVFVRLVDCLRLYRTYISNYDRSIEVLSENLEKPKFRAWIDEQHNTHDTLSLSNILITPIQRIPRYSLLLQELLKHMSTRHEDFENVNKALEGVLAVADYLEEERGKSENINKVISIQEKIEGSPVKLVQPYRSFIAEGELMEERGALKLRHFFLFNDILIVSSPKKNKYRFKILFELEQTKVVALPKESKPCSFRIMYIDENFDFTCPTPEEKAQWLGKLSTAIYNYKKNEFTRKVASQNLGGSPLPERRAE